jgi:iron complex transport system permease protein
MRVLGKSAVLYPLLGLALAVSMLAGLSVGAAEDLTAAKALAILAHKLGLIGRGDWLPYEEAIMNLRLPRVLIAALVGAGLAISGCCLQGLFNNPLASPDILGVSSGAALGAVGAIVLGVEHVALVGAVAVNVLPLFAFAGALASSIVVYVVATRHGRTPVASLLLAGIALNAILGAGVSFLLTMHIGDVGAARRIVHWLIGGLEDRLWEHVWMAAPFVILGIGAALFLARDLNCLALGEETAASLGVSVQRLKIEILLIVAVASGACVSVSGVLAFVGLVVPHMIRMLIGPDHRRLLPACVLGGAAFLVLVDLISRIAIRPQEIQIGILTSLVGGPFFLMLLVYHRKKVEAL